MSTPAGKSGARIIRAAANVTADYVASEILEIDTARTIHLFIRIDTAATGDVVSIVPQGAFEVPGVLTSSWVPFPSSDGTVTEVDLAGNFPAGTTFTGEDFGSQTILPLEIRTAAADSATHKRWISAYLNAGAFRRFRVLVKGTTGTPSVLIAAATAN